MNRTRVRAQALVSKPHPRARTRVPGQRIREPWNDLGLALEYEMDDGVNDIKLSVFYHIYHTYNP
jgi:hypothetical protein